MKNTLHPLHLEHLHSSKACIDVTGVRGVPCISQFQERFGEDISELSRLFATAFIRLLDSRRNETAPQNPLDSLEQESDELGSPRATGGTGA